MWDAKKSETLIRRAAGCSVPQRCSEMIYGYARVSTGGQTTDGQTLALVSAGIPADQITCETISGAVPAAKRPGLSGLLAQLEGGDVLAVARLDRIGRDPADVLAVLRDLEGRGVGVRLLDMGADTSSPAGRLVVAVLAAVAGWERDVLRERTRQGLAAARARGAHLGRKHRLTFHQRQEARRLAGEGKSVSEVAALFQVSRSVAHRAMHNLLV